MGPSHSEGRRMGVVLADGTLFVEPLLVIDSTFSYSVLQGPFPRYIDLKELCLPTVYPSPSLNDWCLLVPVLSHPSPVLYPS